MSDYEPSETDEFQTTVRPKHEWAKQMLAIKKDGEKLAYSLHKQGHNFIVRILSSKQVKSGDTIPMSGVTIQLDWKVSTKLEMVKLSNDLIYKAYILDFLDPAFPTILTSVIEGKSLYEHSIGEFFQMYGKFEGKFQLTKGQDTEQKMMELVNGEENYLKNYREHGQWKLVPLPYAIRNILAHTGQNPNKLDQDGEELKMSIQLLKSWTSPTQEG